MNKHHEIRDPIHVFIRLDSNERKVVDSRPFQRLRDIHQLAMTYLVYPGATHKRFEHSLGVMELAGRVFDVVTNPLTVHDDIRRTLPEILDEKERLHWRQTLRMAALSHDVGHLPFSHAAEDELLPDKWDHERLSRELILSDELRPIWSQMHLTPEEIVKLAVGPKKASDLVFSDWETILSEIITGNAFGVDRIDYLLRDSYHTGVAYGRFDHFRLIDTLRILPPPRAPGDTDYSLEPSLGIEHGGLQSAEALLLARYFMYSQVYFHRVRRIYDIHLKEFLREWLPKGSFPTSLSKHLSCTDNEVLSAIRKAASQSSSKGHDPARRTMNREHFRLVYEYTPSDVDSNPKAAELFFQGLCTRFGTEKVRFDSYKQKNPAIDFPVQMLNGDIASARSLSQILANIPILKIEYVFVEPQVYNEAMQWIRENRARVLGLQTSIAGDAQ